MGRGDRVGQPDVRSGAVDWDAADHAATVSVYAEGEKHSVIRKMGIQLNAPTVTVTRSGQPRWKCGKHLEKDSKFGIAARSEAGLFPHKAVMRPVLVLDDRSQSENSLNFLRCFQMFSTKFLPSKFKEITIFYHQQQRL